MSSVAPIAALRVAGIRPAMPAPGSDPYEDGLDVELVTEAVPVAAQASERVPPTVAAARVGSNATRATGFDPRPGLTTTLGRPVPVDASPVARAYAAHAAR